MTPHWWNDWNVLNPVQWGLVVLVSYTLVMGVTFMALGHGAGGSFSASAVSGVVLGCFVAALTRHKQSPQRAARG